MVAPCRLCLGQFPVTHSIFENQTSMMLEALTSLKVTPDDHFSTSICTKCSLNLRLAYRIRQDFIAADKKFKEAPLDHQVQQVKIKEEVIEENTEEVDGNNKVTRCPICGTLVREEHLMGHLRSHFDHISQECCSIRFSSQNHYRSHVTKEHRNVVHVCPKCGAKFRYRPLFEVHVTQAHPKAAPTNKFTTKFVSPRVIKMALKSYQDRPRPDPITCEICSKNFYEARTYRAHTYTHEKLQCHICKLSISRPGFKRHVAAHTAIQKPHVCEICGTTLKSLDSYRGHMYYTHSKKRLQCDDCGRIFTKSYLFDLHKRKDHGGEKTHVCDTCGKGFYTLHRLLIHMNMTHLKVRSHVCAYCKKGFSSKFALKTHVRQHTNEAPYKCEVCGEGFRQNVSLRTHRKSKHGITEPVTCSCSTCGKEFASDHALKSHMLRLHST